MNTHLCGHCNSFVDKAIDHGVTIIINFVSELEEEEEEEEEEDMRFGERLCIYHGGGKISCSEDL